MASFVRLRLRKKQIPAIQARRLSWNDLAQVLHEDEGAPLEGAALTREAARLRKRFQLVKERLYEMGREAGLLGEG